MGGPTRSDPPPAPPSLSDLADALCWVADDELTLAGRIALPRLPELWLAEGVLLQAILDLCNRPCNSHEHRDAYWYVFEADPEDEYRRPYPFAFEAVCDLLRLSVIAVRARVREMMKVGQAPTLRHLLRRSLEDESGSPDGSLAEAPGAGTVVPAARRFCAHRDRDKRGVIPAPGRRGAARR